MRWDGYAACMGCMRNSYKILGEKLGRKRSVGRLRRKWEYNIETDLKEIRCVGVD
jgi:hypothetical protein